MGYYAGLDIGGTSGRLLLSDEQGNRVGEYRHEGISIFSGAEEEAREKYGNLVLPALEKYHWTPQECRGICVAASGIDSESMRENVKKLFVDMGFAPERVLVFNDCEIFLQVYHAPSMILIAGTGSIAYGIDGGGAVVRTGGWGHILSDEGSGFYIGMEIVRAMGNHLDEREKDDILYGLFHEATGIDDLEALNTFLIDNVITKNAISSLAPLAERAAAQGSAVAGRILDDTADKLYRLVRDNYRKMSKESEEPLTVVLWGGVLLKSEAIRARVTEGIRRDIPDVKIRTPEKGALEIALDTALAYGKGRA